MFLFAAARHPAELARLTWGRTQIIGALAHSRLPRQHKQTDLYAWFLIADSV